MAKRAVRAWDHTDLASSPMMSAVKCVHGVELTQSCARCEYQRRLDAEGYGMPCS